MTYDMANTDKLNEYRRDAMRLGIEVVPPSVLTSYRLFEVGENRIYYSLAAIKGVGDAAVEHIVEKRKEKQFESIEDFCSRVDPRIIGKRVLESLICAGAFDCFGHDRAALFQGIDRLMGLSARAAQDAALGQGDIFGAAALEPQKLHLPISEPWLPAERLHREFVAVGCYLSAHPLDDYREALEKMRVQNWSVFQAAVKRGATAGRLAGTITAKQERKTKTGNKMGIVQFSDASGQYEAVLFSEALNHYRDILEPGKSVVITVQAEDRPEGVNLRLQTVHSLDEEAAKMQKALRIYVRDPKPLPSITSQLTTRGEGQVSLIVIKEGGAGEVEVSLPDKYRLSPQIAAAMRSVQGVVDVELV
jgi:DNA polymerase-3 subunit alpha